MERNKTHGCLGRLWVKFVGLFRRDRPMPLKSFTAKVQS